VLDASPALKSIAASPKHDAMWAVGPLGATLRLDLSRDIR
jgi:hypothetical protein